MKKESLEESFVFEDPSCGFRRETRETFFPDNSEKGVTESFRESSGKEYASKTLLFENGVLYGGYFIFSLDTDWDINLIYDLQELDKREELRECQISFVESGSDWDYGHFGKATYQDEVLASVESGRFTRTPDTREDFMFDLFGANWREVMSEIAQEVMVNKGHLLSREDLNSEIYMAQQTFCIEKMESLPQRKRDEILRRNSMRGRESYVVFKKDQTDWQATFYQGDDELDENWLPRQIRFGEWIEYDELKYRLTQEGGNIKLVVSTISESRGKIITFPTRIDLERAFFYLQQSRQAWLPFREEFKATFIWGRVT